MLDAALKKTLTGYLLSDITEQLEPIEIDNINNAFNTEFNNIFTVFKNVNTEYFNRFITKFEDRIKTLLGTPEKRIGLLNAIPAKHAMDFLNKFRDSIGELSVEEKISILQAWSLNAKKEDFKALFTIYEQWKIETRDIENIKKLVDAFKGSEDRRNAVLKQIYEYYINNVDTLTLDEFNNLFNLMQKTHKGDYSAELFSAGVFNVYFQTSPKMDPEDIFFLNIGMKLSVNGSDDNLDIIHNFIAETMTKDLSAVLLDPCNFNVPNKSWNYRYNLHYGQHKLEDRFQPYYHRVWYLFELIRGNEDLRNKFMKKFDSFFPDQLNNILKLPIDNRDFSILIKKMRNTNKLKTLIKFIPLDFYKFLKSIENFNRDMPNRGLYLVQSLVSYMYNTKEGNLKKELLDAINKDPDLTIDNFFIKYFGKNDNEPKLALLSDFLNANQHLTTQQLMKLLPMSCGKNFGNAENYPINLILKRLLSEFPTIQLDNVFFAKQLELHRQQQGNLLDIEEEHILKLFTQNILDAQKVLEYVADKKDLIQSKNFINKLEPHKQSEFFDALQWRLERNKKTEEISYDYNDLKNNIIPVVKDFHVAGGAVLFSAAFALAIVAFFSVAFPPFLIAMGICIGLGILCSMAARLVGPVVDKFSKDIPYAGTGTLEQNRERCKFLSQLNNDTKDYQETLKQKPESQKNSTEQITTALGKAVSNQQVGVDNVETSKPNLDNNWNRLDANTFYEPLRPSKDCDNSNGNNYSDDLSMEDNNRYMAGEYNFGNK